MDITEQIQAARRELTFRRNCYPGWVNKGKMSQAEADHQLKAMEEIIKTLEGQQSIHNYLFRSFPEKFLADDATATNVIALLERCKVRMTTQVKDVTDFINNYLPNVKFSDFEKKKLQQILERSKKG